MEKLMYIVWKPLGQSSEQFRDAFISQTSGQLAAAGAKKIRLTIADSEVAAAHKLRIVSAQLAAPPSVPDAIVSFWLSSADNRTAIENILKGHSNVICGYLVTEIEPLPNITYVAPPGQRTPGMNQVVFLKIPTRLARETWLELWLKQHTPIATTTQSTFGYRQNVVVRAFSDNALPIDAIVEENFPPEAMTSSHAFYNAVGDDKLMRKNQAEMFASVQRFIDLDKLDCLPMSEYNF